MSNRYYYNEECCPGCAAALLCTLNLLPYSSVHNEDDYSVGVVALRLRCPCGLTSSIGAMYQVGERTIPVGGAWAAQIMAGLGPTPAHAVRLSCEHLFFEPPEMCPRGVAAMFPCKTCSTRDFAPHFLGDPESHRDWVESTAGTFTIDETIKGRISWAEVKYTEQVAQDWLVRLLDLSLDRGTAHQLVRS
jgi:hypothetical protein